MPIREGQTAKQAVDSMVKLAKHAENIGIERYWIAEHHNMKNLASSATQLLIQRALSTPKKLRVGSGGVMLPNHSPYIAGRTIRRRNASANRVELGLGRGWHRYTNRLCLTPRVCLSPMKSIKKATLTVQTLFPPIRHKG